MALLDKWKCDYDLNVIIKKWEHSLVALPNISQMYHRKINNTLMNTHSSQFNNIFFFYLFVDKPAFLSCNNSHDEYIS